MGLLNGYLQKVALNPEELHNLRKINRRILNASLLKLLGGDTESFGTYAYLRKVNTDIGILLDEIKMKPKGLANADSLITIPEVSIHQITEFISRIINI